MKKIILLSLLLFFSSLFLYGQQNVIDSLSQVLKTAKDDTNKVKTLNKITSLYFQVPPNYIKALPFAEESKVLSEKLFYKEGAAVAYNNLGIGYAYFGVYEKAFDNYLKELRIWEVLKDTERVVQSNINLAHIYSMQGNYQKALEVHLLIEKTTIKRGDKERIADALWSLSDAYIDLCKQAIKKDDSLLVNFYYDHLINCRSRALDISKEIKNTSEIAFYMNNLGYVFDKCNLCKDSQLVKETGLIKHNFFSLVLENYLTAIKYYKKTNDSSGISWSYGNIGLFYKHQGDLFKEKRMLTQANMNYRQSLDNYLIAFKIIKELGYKHGIANYSKDVGIAYLRLGKKDQAEEYILNAANGFKEIGYKEGAKESYEMLSEVSLEKQDYKKALEYYKNYSALKDSLLNEGATKQLAEMSVKYETEKKDNEILLLNKEKQITEGKIKQQSRDIFLIASVAASLLLTTVIIFLLHKRRKTKYNLKIQQMEIKFLRSQLKPHFVSNALLAIRRYIRQHPEVAEEYLDKYSNLMREVLINSEEEMISLEEEFSMLKKYMDLESLRVKNGFDYEVTIDSSINSEAVKVPPLILQPIVENAIWHGIAGRTEKGKILIYVSMGKMILLCVIENHCGGTQTAEVEPTKKGKSFGLQISRERLKLLAKEKKGKWYLETTPEIDGMKVQLGIPL